MRHICIAVVLCYLGMVATAQNAGFEYSTNCRDAYHAILRYDLKAARQLSAKELAENSDNALPFYLQNYADFLEAIVSDKEALTNAYGKKSEYRLEKLKSAKKGSPYYHFCIAEVHLQNALLLIKKSDYFSSAMQLRQSYRHLEINEKEHPDFLLTGKSLYPLRALIGAVPANYRWLLSLAGYDADLNESMLRAEALRKKLQSDSSCEIYYKESTAILAFLQLNLMNNAAEAWLLTKEATKDYQTNPLSAFLRANIASNLKRNDEAIAILQPHVVKQPVIPHLDYLMGNALLQKLKPGARYYFLRYIKNYQGHHYVKDSYLKIGWSYLLEEDTSSYRGFMHIVEREGAEIRDEDKQAMKEIQTDYASVAYLLKARLLFDGGYYDKALIALHETSPGEAQGTGRLCEYYYRSARIYHHLGNTTQALLDYNAAIKAGKNEDTYFPPAACFLSGLIYETRGQTDSAAVMYRACIEYDGYSYKRSFDQKATAALKRIRKAQ